MENIDNTNIADASENVDTSQQDQPTPENPVSEIPPKKERKKVHLLESLKLMGLRIAGVFKDYPVAMISIVIAAFIGAVLIEWNHHDTKIYLERAIAFCLILAFQSIFLEEIFTSKKIIRFTGYAVSAIISATYVYILSFEGETFLGIEMEIVGTWLMRVLIVHGMAFICVSIHHMFRRLEENFEVYAARAFLELVKSTVIYGLFALGLAAIIWIFNELIFDTDDFLSQVELFLAGGIYVPMCLKSISGKNDEPGKFARVCFLYVLQPMLLVAFAIIYLYIVKIFVISDIPSNRVFNILAFLFAIGMPVWTVIHGMEQKKSILQKAVVFLPYVFIPFVLLQLWSIGIRIAQYGYTTARYQGLVLVICEAVYFGLYLWHHVGRKRAIGDILYVLIAVSFFGILCPVTNRDDVVINSQMKRVVKLLDKGDLTDNAELKSAFRAVSYTGYKGKRILRQKLTEGQIAKIEEMPEYADLMKDIVYLYGSKSFTDVDVSAYSSICAVDDNYLNDDGKLTVAIRHDGYNSENLNVDIHEFTDYLMENYHESYNSNFIKDHYIVKAGPDMDIYITYFSMEYDKNTKKIESISLSGYLMRK